MIGKGNEYMAVFKFKKGTHIDHLFDKVTPIWNDIWDIETDLILCDCDILIVVTKNGTGSKRKSTEITPTPDLMAPTPTPIK